MKQDVQKFIDCLLEAEDLLGGYSSKSYPQLETGLAYVLPNQLSLTLFEKLPEFRSFGDAQKWQVRTIKHLSCTGGSVITKCLAAMPNVALLSEANPLSRQHIVNSPRFSPTDLTSLAIYAKFPQIDELSEKIFKAGIKVIVKHTRSLGKHLLIREHSHGDMLSATEPFTEGSINKSLSEDYQLNSILTVRHPADSFLSLVDNGWVEFIPGTLEEYCRRYQLFMEQNNQLESFKYEDFVSNPQIEIKRMCKAIDLPYHEDFMEVFDISAVTGDSGRRSNIIDKRARRGFDPAFLEETRKSKQYKKLCDLLNYVSDL
ncbi:MAG: sulfotransferase [Xanthomonadales bacterium]|nr:sulfotransferase [Xanthomonadales bacterium]